MLTVTPRDQLDIVATAWQPPGFTLMARLQDTRLVSVRVPCLSAARLLPLPLGWAAWSPFLPRAGLPLFWLLFASVRACLVSFVPLKPFRAPIPPPVGLPTLARPAPRRPLAEARGFEPGAASNTRDAKSRPRAKTTRLQRRLRHTPLLGRAQGKGAAAHGPARGLGVHS